MNNNCLLSYVSESYDNVSLNRTALIGVQHILPSTLDMMQVFINHGLKEDHIFLLGKCYSTNPDTYEAMVERGIHVCEGSFAFDPDKSFDEVFSDAVERFIERALLTIDPEQFEKIVIIDDGGALISAIQKLPKSFTDKVVAIEQTSAGYHRIKDKKLSSPVINVARADAKLKYETPSVAAGITAGLKRRLPKQRTKTLIMGNGVVGQACHAMLKDEHDIAFFDADPSKSCIPHHEFAERLSEFDVILGVTGSTSIGPEHHDSLKEDVILVSGSSSDREFAAIEFRKKATGVSHCHQDIAINGVTLVNCGFPVNFSNDFDNVDTSGFQLTRGLLTTAVFQAYLTDNVDPTLIDVDLQMQEELLEKHLDTKV